MPETACIDLAGSIMAGWEKFLQKESRSGGVPRNYVYASQYHPCVRHLHLAMTKGHELPPFPAEVLAKFRRGNDRERNLLADLSLIGRDATPPFSVEAQQQHFSLNGRHGQKILTGKMDARLRFQNASYPLEVKSWSPQLVDRIKTFQDLHENVWTRAGARQILAYLLGAGEETGFMLLDRQGLPLLLEVYLWADGNHALIDEFMDLAEKAVDYLEVEEEPPYIEDAAECKRCKFYGAFCNPPLVSDAATILTDEELEADLKRREELKDAAKEFKNLDEDVKKRLRGIELGICGNFLLEGKYGKSSKLVLPKEIEEKYTITDPAGRFTLKITPIGDAK